MAISLYADRRQSGTMTFPYLVRSPSTAAEAKVAEVASRTLLPATAYNVDQPRINTFSFEYLLRRERRPIDIPNTSKLERFIGGVVKHTSLQYEYSELATESGFSRKTRC